MKKITLILLSILLSGCVSIRDGGPSFRAVVWEDRSSEWSTADQILVVIMCIEDKPQQGVFDGQRLMCIAPHDVSSLDTLIVVRNLFTNNVAPYFGVDGGKYVLRRGVDRELKDEPIFTPYYKKQ